MSTTLAMTLGMAVGAGASDTPDVDPLSPSLVLLRFEEGLEVRRAATAGEIAFLTRDILEMPLKRPDTWPVFTVERAGRLLAVFRVERRSGDPGALRLLAGDHVRVAKVGALAPPSTPLGVLVRRAVLTFLLDWLEINPNHISHQVKEQLQWESPGAMGHYRDSGQLGLLPRSAGEEPMPIMPRRHPSLTSAWFDRIHAHFFQLTKRMFGQRDHVIERDSGAYPYHMWIVRLAGSSPMTLVMVVRDLMDEDVPLEWWFWMEGGELPVFKGPLVPPMPAPGTGAPTPVEALLRAGYLLSADDFEEWLERVALPATPGFPGTVEAYLELGEETPYMWALGDFNEWVEDVCGYSSLLPSP